MVGKPTYEELENGNRDLKRLYEVGTVTDTPSSLEKTLQPIVVHITAVFNVSGCAILLWHRDKNQVENIIDYRRAYPENVDESGRIYDLDKYPETLRALETNQIYHVQKGDPEADESELALMEEQEVFEILGLPLTENNHVLGILEIYGDDKFKKFTKQEIQLATALTSQAAIAVKNAQLYESAQSEIIKRKKTEKSLIESEAKFRGLIEASSDWIWEVDIKGVYKYSSPQVKTILGYEPDEILNKTLFDIISPEDRQLVGQTFNSIVKNPCNINNFEKRCLHKNGNIVILKTSGIPIINKAGILTGFRGVNRNITNRKQGEEKLKESEKNFRTIIEQAPVSTEIYTLDGFQIQVNKAWEKMWNAKPEDAIGKFNILTDPQMKKTSVYPQIKDAFVKHNMQFIEEWYFNPEISGFKGRARFMRTHIYPIRNEEGENSKHHSYS